MPSRAGFGWAVVAVALIGVTVAALRRPRAVLRNASEPPAAVANVDGPQRPGEVIFERYILPQPPGYVGTEDCARFENRWVFYGQTSSTLPALLRRFGFTDAQVTAFASAARCAGDRCTVTPPLDALESLSPEARGAAQVELGLSSDNPIAAAPYRWPTSLPAWSTATSLSPRARALLERATFTRGDESIFVDIPLACATLATDDERRGLLEVIKRRVAGRAWVRVPADAPVDEMARYWSSSPADVTPLRERLEAARNGRVSVRDLLPPMPRARLDTFPGLHDPALDCYWSALHFFDAAPSQALPDASGLSAALARGYERVASGAERFGDVVVFYGVNGEPIHAFNHVADGVVFSKDGGSPRRPWLLERFDDVRRSYPRAVTVQAWRRRGPAAR